MLLATIPTYTKEESESTLDEAVEQIADNPVSLQDLLSGKI